MKPIIGISVDCRRDPEDARTGGTLTLNWNYAEAVATSGGVPILIPPTADMEVVAGLIDAWLIPGGDDIDASRFGESNHPQVRLQDPARFDSEMRLYRSLEGSAPILGICYGCQFLNVAQGGSLIQHLPDIEGTEIHTGGPTQEYDLKPDSMLANIIGATAMEGKSYHHQAVKSLGKNLVPTAWMKDGTIEAIETQEGRWLIGVQWHPERSYSDPHTRALFDAFVQAAKAHAQDRRSKVAV